MAKWGTIHPLVVQRAPKLKRPLDFSLEVTGSGDLGYTFFEKPMKSKWVTPANSAASEENRNTWVSNDLVRRLLRISEDVFERDVQGTNDDYDRKLVYSGYSLKQRTQIVERVICDHR